MRLRPPTIMISWNKLAIDGYNPFILCGLREKFGFSLDADAPSNHDIYMTFFLCKCNVQNILEVLFQ